jgi:AraC-like DNA-binding protein
VRVILSSRPAPTLRHLIRYYYQVETQLVGRTVMQPVPARSPQAIEFTFGTPYEVHRLDRGNVEQAHSIALIGAQTFRRVDLVMQGTVDAFTIVFQPGGLFMLFRLPGEVTTNDHFEGEAALGRRLGDLERRLGDVASFSDRVRVANEYLSAKRPAFDAVSVTAKAAAEVLLRSGRVRVSDLARHTGLGIRQFERRFRYEIGIPPKLYARIARFEAALQRRAAAPDRRWTDIAHGLGYHDQMHMVHDFNRLSGDSPTAIGSRLDMFVQPEVVSAGRPQQGTYEPCT